MKWWKVSYHENELAKAYANLGFAKELMKRGDFDEEANVPTLIVMVTTVF